MKKLTTEEFIKKVREVHGDKYDYSKVDYKDSKTKITIICPEHGEFEQRPKDHLRGQGCSKCFGNAKLITEEFIKKAREVHGDKYDYSKVEYKNYSTKITIICPEHGEFQQIPNNHLIGSGCPKCSCKAKSTTEKFIKKAREVHGDKYDYSKAEYKGALTKITIICPEHGEFEQQPKNHLSGQGCSKCAGNSKLTVEKFIKKAREVHGDKYDYSKVEYKNANTKITIICPEHGEFKQRPGNHLRSRGCSMCSEITQCL